MTPLEELADWASLVTPADVPAEQHRLVRARLLDTMGLIAVAADQPAGGSLTAWAAANAGSGATVLPTGAQAAPAVAALVHGSLAHARDFDDTFPDTVVHPGSTVIAAALSAAQARDASFDDLSTAIVVGYEIAARLGAAAGRGFHARGFHATSIVGPIAAAATAGRILALAPAAMADALGLATSMSGGLLAFLADGGWSKWLHTGWAAHGGLIAADLASHAFRGPHHALDHRYGLYGAFLGAPAADLGVITASLGQTWLGATARAKHFPCAHVIQPYIEAVLAWRSDGQFSADAVQSVRCVVAPWALPIVAEPRAVKLAPENDLDAIASLPFMVAAALCDGRVDLATLRPETLERSDIRALAARIVCDGDQALGSGFDGRIEAVLAGGERIRCDVALSAPSEERMVAKFRTNTAHLQHAACMELETALLSGAPGSRALVQLAATAMTSGKGARPKARDLTVFPRDA
jgi:2-methylcitrate dehydratase PrpD